MITPDPASAARLALAREVFIQQTGAMTADEYAQWLWDNETIEAERRAELAAERYYEEGPAHIAFYNASMNDLEEARAAYGLDSRW